ncbi:unnamed protein product [Blumeria hordei]|uniref:TLC domain-containing protein n=2 Tax=Blumeria hordei TaxID=2867405 RepID=A0A383UK23_BLUHO|nr:DUF887 domain protein [Blumeria hordei DH14]SZF00078.1 unnamed protein product [Blumeria hordei]
MLDPFFPPPAFLQSFITPVSEFFNLRTLPLHIHEITAAFLLHHAIFEYVAPIASSKLLPAKYGKLPSNSKLRWNIHCASMVQSVTISILTIYILAFDKERLNMTSEERIWGYTGAAGLIQALACGYFLFDLVTMVRHLDVFGVPMLIHAASCFATYSIGFRPICNYYGCVFMLYELSTPFLNIHWFFDKLGMTGTKAQLYNGLVLLGVFFSARLVWGTYASLGLYQDVMFAWKIRSNTNLPVQSEIMKYGYDRALPLWLILLYLFGHIALNTLNIYWFNKMLDAVKKRFIPKSEQKRN